MRDWFSSCKRAAMLSMLVAPQLATGTSLCGSDVALSLTTSDAVNAGGAPLVFDNEAAMTLPQEAFTVASLPSEEAKEQLDAEGISQSPDAMGLVFFAGPKVGFKVPVPEGSQQLMSGKYVSVDERQYTMTQFHFDAPGRISLALKDGFKQHSYAAELHLEFESAVEENKSQHRINLVVFIDSSVSATEGKLAGLKLDEAKQMLIEACEENKILQEEAQSSVGLNSTYYGCFEVLNSINQTVTLSHLLPATNERGHWRFSIPTSCAGANGTESLQAPSTDYYVFGSPLLLHPSEFSELFSFLETTKLSAAEIEHMQEDSPAVTDFEFVSSTYSCPPLDENLISSIYASVTVEQEEINMWGSILNNGTKPINLAGLTFTAPFSMGMEIADGVWGTALPADFVRSVPCNCDAGGFCVHKFPLEYPYASDPACDAIDIKAQDGLLKLVFFKDFYLAPGASIAAPPKVSIQANAPRRFSSRRNFIAS